MTETTEIKGKPNGSQQNESSKTVNKIIKNQNGK